MRALIALLAFGFVAVSAHPGNSQRIIGGDVTTIEQYPSIVALLATSDWVTWWQSCAGSIINSRHVLTAAHCVYQDAVSRWRVRSGSTWANSGGEVHAVSVYTVHHFYSHLFRDNDVAILRLSSFMSLNSNAQAGFFAGTNYDLGDNEEVWAVGWGQTSYNGERSEQLRHVQVWTISRQLCAGSYYAIQRPISANMLCTGVLNVGGRDQCVGDNGGPVYHRGVIVGVTSWGRECAHPLFPRVNARVSRYPDWIRSNS